MPSESQRTGSPLIVRSLFYWDGRPNFGDVLSKFVVASLLGKELPKAHAGEEGVLLAVGSILHYAPRFRAPVVWGTGYEPRYGKSKPSDATILALRGPLSCEAMGVRGIPLGDPAILLPRFHTPRGERHGEVGVAPHHGSMSTRRGALVRAALAGGKRVIDPRRDWREVVDDIAGCSFLFCESLHGAIIAQSYGVPWAWWKGLHGWSAGFKWADWFGSLGAEPKGFALTDLRRAQRWAARVSLKTPDADALAHALTDRVVAG